MSTFRVSSVQCPSQHLCLLTPVHNHVPGFGFSATRRQHFATSLYFFIILSSLFTRRQKFQNITCVPMQHRIHQNFTAAISQTDSSAYLASVYQHVIVFSPAVRLCFLFTGIGVMSLTVLRPCSSLSPDVSLCESSVANVISPSCAFQSRTEYQ